MRYWRRLRRSELPVPPFAAVREPPFSLTPRASARVELALEGAFRVHDSAFKELRASIEACVGELQGQGMLPEAMVITMRAFVEHTASHPSAQHPVAARAANLFIDRIIHWSILAYYPSTTPPKRPRSAPQGEES
jgi:hypothetical protein